MKIPMDLQNKTVKYWEKLFGGKINIFVGIKFSNFAEATACQNRKLFCGKKGAEIFTPANKIPEIKSEGMIH